MCVHLVIDQIPRIREQQVQLLQESRFVLDVADAPEEKYEKSLETVEYDKNVGEDSVVGDVGESAEPGDTQQGGKRKAAFHPNP